MKKQSLNFLTLITFFLLLPLNKINVRANDEILKECLAANDYKGCVKTLSEKNENFQVKIRNNGKLAIYDLRDIRAIPLNGQFGTLLEWGYEIARTKSNPKRTWKVIGDCERYRAKWNGDSFWTELNSSDKRNSSKSEAKSLMDEYCPRMNNLVKIEKQKEVYTKSFLDIEIENFIFNRSKVQEKVKVQKKVKDKECNLSKYQSELNQKDTQIFELQKKIKNLNDTLIKSERTPKKRIKSKNMFNELDIDG